MITRLKLKPGQNGTKKLVKQYGESLVCVRYRYDETSGMRFTTVELIIKKSKWTPPAKKYSDDALVPVHIGFTDIASREKAKEARGRWDPEAKLWFIRYGNIKGTSLEKHIILDTFPTGQKSKSI